MLGNIGGNIGGALWMYAMVPVNIKALGCGTELLFGGLRG